MKPPAFAVAGWKNSGKTTLVERLVAEFRSRGLRVATVKRSHDAFLMDVEGTDTDRHRKAGAEAVVMVGPNGWSVARTGSEPSVDEVLDALAGHDLVIAEGYKSSTLPILEVRGPGEGKSIAEGNPNVFAVATDRPSNETHLPVHERDDVRALADLAWQRVRPR